MLIKQNLKIILSNLIPELNKITIDYLASTGLERKSNLIQSTEFVETESGLALYSAYYFQYRSSGRRPGVRKVPITALIDYIKRYNIQPRPGQTLTSLAFAIQTAIYKRGITGLNYFDRIIQTTADVAEQAIADEFTEELVGEIITLMTATKYAVVKN